MLSPEATQKHDASAALDDCVETSSIAMDDGKPPQESIDDASNIFSSPTRAILAKNSTAIPNATTTYSSDDSKKFQAETQRFSFLTRPQSPRSSDLTTFSFSAPKPQVGKFYPPIPPNRRCRSPIENVTGEPVSVSQVQQLGVLQGVKSSTQALHTRERQSPPTDRHSPDLPGGELGPKRVVDNSRDVESLNAVEQVSQTSGKETTAEGPATNMTAKPETNDVAKIHDPLLMLSVKPELMSGLRDGISAAADADLDSPVTLSRKSEEPPRHRSKLQSSLSSHKYGFEEGHSRAEESTGKGQHLVRHQQPPVRRQHPSEPSFTPLGNRRVEDAFRVSKQHGKPTPKRSMNISQATEAGSIVEQSLSEDDVLFLLANQLRERKKAEGAALAAQREMSLEIDALTKAYNDSYSNWETAQKLCEEQELELGRYHQAHKFWKQKFSGYEKFMAGFKNDFDAQAKESHKLKLEVESAKFAETAIKTELADLVETTAKDLESSAASLAKATKYAHHLTQPLNESETSLVETSRLLAAERVKTARLEGIIDEKTHKYESQVQIFQTGQTVLVERFVEITNLVRECKESVSSSREETLYQLKRCRMLIEALCEEEAVCPADVEEVKASIRSLVERSINSHMTRSDGMADANTLTETFLLDDFKSRLSELRSLLEKNESTKERITTLYEEQKKLEAQLYANESALVVSQYEIADRDARYDLLKRRNLDLETSQKVYQDLEVEHDDAITQNQELKTQISSLKETFKETTDRIEKLEEELEAKETELQQKEEAIGVMNETLKSAQVSVSSLREASDADFEKRCEELNRQWSNFKDQESAKEIGDLQNALNQDICAKKIVEQELEDLKSGQEKFKLREEQLQNTIKKSRAQRKDLEDQLSDKDRSYTLMDQELRALSERLQSKDANVQLFRESAEAQTAEITECMQKLATAESELVELRAKIQQMETTSEKSPTQTQLITTLELDLEKKDEEVISLRAQRKALEHACNKVEGIFRRIGLLKSEEIFNEQGMETVAERITVLQLHEAQRSVSIQEEAREAQETTMLISAKVPSMPISHKTRRKADRSNSHAGRIMPTSNSLQAETQADTLRRDTQVEIEHRFHGVASSKISFNQLGAQQSHASTAGIASAAHILGDHFTQTPVSQALQKASTMASSPLSTHHSSEFGTPSELKSTPKGRVGTTAHEHPLSTRAELAKASQGPSNKNNRVAKEKPCLLTAPRADIEADLPLDDSSLAQSDKQAKTYNGQRSILKDVKSPKHKRPSADAPAMQSVRKRVKLNPPSSRGSDVASEEPLNTSTYFASTVADPTDSGRLSMPHQKPTPKARVASKSSSKSHNTRRGSYTAQKYNDRFSKESTFNP